MKTSREALVDIAFSLFLERGYDKVTMNDLVTASGLSKGAFHHYFPRKPDLFHACLEKFFLAFLPESQEEAPVFGSARELVLAHAAMQKGLLEELGRLGLNTRQYWRFILDLPQSWQDRLHTGMDQAERAMEQAFAQDKARGLLRPGSDPVLLARTATAILEGHGIISAVPLPEVDVQGLVQHWLEGIYLP